MEGVREKIREFSGFGRFGEYTVVPKAVGGKGILGGLAGYPFSGSAIPGGLGGMQWFQRQLGEREFWAVFLRGGMTGSGDKFFG